MIYHKEHKAQWAQYKIKYQAQLKENNKMSNNIYNILGKLKGITDNAALTPDTEATTVYESVDARGSITEAVKSLEAKYQTFKEAAAKPDFLDVDKDGDKAEPFKKAVKDKKAKKVEESQNISDAAYDEPEAPNADAIAKRKRLQALKDKQEDERAMGSKDETNTPIRKVAGKAYGGAAQADEPNEFENGNFIQRKKSINLGPNDDLDEVAPPGAKAERMVKHIKKGYAKDGKLTNKEKAIAYATTWAAHKKGQVEEGVEFKDAGKIKNSAANMKKAKLAKVTESRVMEETDYFYEKVGKALAEKNPTLDTSTGDFTTAVRKEMVAQGLDVNRARNILAMDQDFLSDVATSYAHCCKELAECGAPMNSHLGGVSELDEIAALAGLPAPMQEADIQKEIGLERSSLEELDEAQGVDVNGKEINVGSIEVEGVYSWDSPDFADAYITYAEFMDGTPLSDEELVQLEQAHGDLVNQAAHDSLQGSGDFLDESTINEAASRKDFRMVADLIKNIPDEAKRKELAQHHADIFKQQNPRFSHDKFYAAAGVVNEAEMAEGNEFSGALAAAKASGAKEFEVAGKRYTVKEDINVNITANGEEDALNLFRKLAGMQPTVAVQNPKSDVRDVEMIPADAESAIAQGIIEPVEVEIVDAVDEERDPEYVNSPREQTAGIDAAIPSGNDLHATKRAYKIAQPGDNPMAVAEAKDTSWSKYTSLLKSLLK
jgi:hypothetical protein